MELNVSLDELIKGEKKQKKSGKYVKQVAVAQSKASSMKRASRVNRSRGIEETKREFQILPPPPTTSLVKSVKISVKNDGRIVGPSVDQISVSRRSPPSRRTGVKERSQNSIRNPKDIKITTRNNRANGNAISSRRDSTSARSDRTTTSRRDSNSRRDNNSSSRRDSNNDSRRDSIRQRRNNKSENRASDDNETSIVRASNYQNNNSNNNETRFTVTTGGNEPFIFNSTPSISSTVSIPSRVVQSSGVRATPSQENVLSTVMSTLSSQSGQGTTLNERFTRLRQNLDNHQF